MDDIHHRLHEAALGLRPWRDALDAIGSLVEADEVAFMGYRSDDLTGGVGGFSFGKTFDDADFEHIRTLMHTYETVDIRAEYGFQLGRVGRWYGDTDIAPAVLQGSSRFYQDVMRRVGLGHALSLATVHSPQCGAGFGVHRSFRHGPFDRAERAVLREILPQLDIASRTWIRLRDQSAEAAASTLMDLPHTGVILLDVRGRLNRLNRVAEPLLRRDNGLFLSNGTLRCEDSLEERKLGEAIEGIARKGLSEARTVTVSRPFGSAPWTVTVLPLVSPDVFGRLRVALLVDGPDLRREGELLALARAYELTTAETELLEALRRGQSMQAIASTRNVSHHTVKTQKRSLFGKLDVHSDAQLMRRLSELGYRLSDGGNAD